MSQIIVDPYKPFSVFPDPGLSIQGQGVGAMINESYSVAFTSPDALGSPITWSIASGSLPPGLSLDSNTGEITGVVPVGTASPSEFTFWLRVDDAFGRAGERPVTIAVGTCLSLMHMEGSHGATTFPDEVPGNTWTRSGSGIISNVQSKFGSTSYDNDGSGRRLLLPDGGNVWQWGSTPYTLDGWFYVDGSWSGPSFPGIWCKRNGNSDTASSWYFWNGVGGGRCNARHNWTIGGAPDAAIAQPANQWIHWAQAYDGENMYLFQDGVRVAFGPVAPATGGSGRSVCLGADYYHSGTGYFPGYIDEFRAMRGACRWKTDFDVPAAPSDFPVASPVA